MLQPALLQYRFLRTYGEGLLADVEPSTAYELSCAGGHHPAWILGHLTHTGLSAVQLLGGDAEGVEALQARFGMGSEPEGSGDDFEALRAGWLDAHERVEAAVAGASEERLAAPNPIESFREAVPTVGDFVAFLLTGHEAIHLGQLSAWRRGRGLDRLF